MTKLQVQLESKLEKLLAERKDMLAEIQTIKSTVLADNPKKNKWLTKIVDDIERLDKYIDQHQNRIDAIKQRQKLAENKIKRKQDTKRKILLGAMLEKWVADGKFKKEDLANELDIFLIRDSDKALFSDYFD